VTLKNTQDELRLSALEEQIFNDIAICEAVWKNTKNPIYVWRAISLSFRVEAERQRIRNGIHPTLPMSCSGPFPSWCLEYLSLAAYGISTLADAVEDDEIDGKMAKARVLPSLGFAKATINAFDQAKSYFARRLDALSIANLKEALSEQKAMATAAEEVGLADARAMYKRLAEFRRVYAGTRDAGPRRPRPKR
jgi:hypothetical protein